MKSQFISFLALLVISVTANSEDTGDLIKEGSDIPNSTFEPLSIEQKVGKGNTSEGGYVPEERYYSENGGHLDNQHEKVEEQQLQHEQQQHEQPQQLYRKVQEVDDHETQQMQQQDLGRLAKNGTNALKQQLDAEKPGPVPNYPSDVALLVAGRFLNQDGAPQGSVADPGRGNPISSNAGPGTNSARGEGPEPGPAGGGRPSPGPKAGPIKPNPGPRLPPTLGGRLPAGGPPGRQPTNPYPDSRPGARIPGRAPLGRGPNGGVRYGPRFPNRGGGSRSSPGAPSISYPGGPGWNQRPNPYYRPPSDNSASSGRGRPGLYQGPSNFGGGAPSASYPRWPGLNQGQRSGPVLGSPASSNPRMSGLNQGPRRPGLRPASGYPRSYSASALRSRPGSSSIRGGRQRSGSRLSGSRLSGNRLNGNRSSGNRLSGSRSRSGRPRSRLDPSADQADTGDYAAPSGYYDQEDASYPQNYDVFNQDASEFDQEGPVYNEDGFIFGQDSSVFDQEGLVSTQVGLVFNPDDSIYDQEDLVFNQNGIGWIPVTYVV